MTDYDFFPLRQSNHKGYSIETALKKVLADLIAAFDSCNFALLALLDLSAAFDTVDHVILLTSLEKYGIADNCLTWIRSYLPDRSQTVVVGAQ